MRELNLYWIRWNDVGRIACYLVVFSSSPIFIIFAGNSIRLLMSAQKELFIFNGVWFWIWKKKNEKPFICTYLRLLATDIHWIYLIHIYTAHKISSCFAFSLVFGELLSVQEWFLGILKNGVELHFMLMPLFSYSNAMNKNTWANQPSQSYLRTISAPTRWVSVWVGGLQIRYIYQIDSPNRMLAKIGSTAIWENWEIESL